MEDSALLVRSQDYGLLTDLYQLTMAACYAGDRLDQRRASFELFVRRLPENFGYLIAMGLAQALEYLEQFRFMPEQIAALQATGIFAHVPDRFWDLLAEGSFTGDVWAVPEGTAVFAHEPILRIEAPLWQAQIVETYLLNTINYQTLIATKSARIRDTAGDTAKLLEFGTRRAFSPQASLWAARAALASGLDATSNVLAALQLGQIPSGTMAHALVMALAALEGSEDQAFTAFHRYFPGAALLIDTYDPIAAAQRLAIQVKAGEINIDAIRLDSGDLVALSQKIRSLLPHVTIFASGDLDEYEIARLQSEGADLQGYGLGTKLVTGVPVNGVYKLVEIDGIPVMKGSMGKSTYPGRKQIFRRFAPESPAPESPTPESPAPENITSGQWQGDRLGLMTEKPALGEQPLLQQVMQQGKRLQPTAPLPEIARRTRHAVAALPLSLRQILLPEAIAPQISSDLETLTTQTQQKIHSFYTEQNPH